MPDNNEIFDLDALDNEANAKPFYFRFDGEVYQCADDVSLEVIKLIEADNVIGAMEEIVGTEQWERIRAAQKTFGVSRMAKVLTEYAKHLGIELGNSSGSTVSSLSTVAPSKRTSSGITASR